MRCLWDRGQTRPRTEIAGQQRRDRGQPGGLVRQDRLRRRAAFGLRGWEARRRCPAPGSRRRRCSSRPARRDRPGQQRLSLRTSKCSNEVPRSRPWPTPPRAWAGDGASSASRVRARGRAPGRRPRPASRPAELALDGARHPLGRRRRMHGREAREDGVDPCDVPRRRPRRTRQILEGERGGEPVVIPTDQAREERLPVERRVDAELVSQPFRRVVIGRDLHERRPPVLEVDDESPVRRGAVPGRSTPSDGRRPDGAAHPFDVGDVGLHHREGNCVMGPRPARRRR